MKDSDAIKRLHDFLLEEEAVPFYDESNKVVTFRGGEAKIRAQAIRQCISIVKSCEVDNGQTDCRDKAA